MIATEVTKWQTKDTYAVQTHTYTHVNKPIRTQMHCKRWKWKQGNSEPEIELPFKGSKSTMAATTTMSIKTTTTTSCKKNSRTKQQTSGRCLKQLFSCKWKGGGLDEHLANSDCLTVPLFLCQAASQHCPVSPLHVAQPDQLPILSVWFCFIIYLPPQLTSRSPALSIQVSTCLSVSQQRRLRKDRGGWVGGVGV